MLSFHCKVVVHISISEHFIHSWLARTHIGTPKSWVTLKILKNIIKWIARFTTDDTFELVWIKQFIRGFFFKQGSLMNHIFIKKYQEDEIQVLHRGKVLIVLRDSCKVLGWDVARVVNNEVWRSADEVCDFSPRKRCYDSRSVLDNEDCNTLSVKTNSFYCFLRTSSSNASAATWFSYQMETCDIRR